LKEFFAAVATPNKNLAETSQSATINEGDTVSNQIGAVEAECLGQRFPTCGTRKSSWSYASNFHFFSQKPGFHSFLVRVSGFVSK